MIINSNSADQLFYKPSVSRTEPPVISTEASDIVTTNVINEDEFQDYVTKQTLLASGFNNITDEYDKLLDILSTRAKMRNVNLSISQDSSQDLTQACNTLFGYTPSSITFDKYIEIAKYKQTTAVSNTTQALDVNNISTTQASPTAELHAADVITKAFKDAIVAQGAEDLLISDPIIYNSSVAASKKALVIESSNTTDGKNPITGGDLVNKGTGDIIKDCLPCIERSLMTLGELPKHDTWVAFNQSIWQQFLNQLQTLAKLKLVILNYDFGQELCTMANILVDSLCLPDLVSLLALINMMIANLKKAYITNLTISAQGISNDLASITVGPVLDAIVALLIRVLNSVLSPLDCVLDSVQYQLGRTYPAIADTIKYFGGNTPDVEKYIPQNATKQLGDFVSKLIKGKQDIENKLYSFINESTKDWKLKTDATEGVLDMYKDMDKLTRAASVFAGLIKLVKDVKSVASLNGDERKKALAQICQESLVTNKPWLQYVSVDTPTDTAPPGDITIKTPGTGTIIDVSIPTDYFDGPDITTILDNPQIQSIVNNLSYDDSVEDGDNLLKLDQDFITAYKNIKSSTIQSVTTTQIITGSLSGIPTTKVDFTKCLNGNASGVSQEQITEWINKVSE